MTRRELDAAGITDPGLRRAYTACRALNARHGRTYFLATRLLTPAQRPAVHALYAFARYVDNLVDEPGTATPDDVEAHIDTTEHALRLGLSEGASGHPVIAALVDTIDRHAIDPGLFAAFLRSMRMDLVLRDYPDRAALATYIHGSAEVIGLQMLPVLGTIADPADAAPAAASLGAAFQLTNFIRDVAEDLDRGRVYLPADELAAFAVDRDRLAWCRRAGRADHAVRRAIADQIARTRAVYAQARPGIAMLAPLSRPCVETALILYSEILDRVAAMDHDVFAARATVPTRRRAGVAARALARVARLRAAGVRQAEGFAPVR
ncbi:phytoene/squalene synthase family protein [Actinokineospora fastidiosa]|uniref:Phytoene synthase n=1 Tax=Actinokineospora fastidiosa TaxID=1816 RepID=A0A918GRH9_9PSEU|nr:phytoene/squalene synthase family protein [Actinokineospora fastidiosa]GGS55137.1 phytoene synthase [Actinokineospora fastidiosa]